MHSTGQNIKSSYLRVSVRRPFGIVCGQDCDPHQIWNKAFLNIPNKRFLGSSRSTRIGRGQGHVTKFVNSLLLSYFCNAQQ